MVALTGCRRLHNAAALVQLRRSEAALRVLESSKDARGRHFEIIRLPLPPPLHYEASEVPTAHGAAGREAGQRLAASYVNFYICNGGVIVPAFGGAASQTDAQYATCEANDHKSLLLLHCKAKRWSSTKSVMVMQGQADS